MTRHCPWCVGIDDPDPDPNALCLDHSAEDEGMSVAQFERRDHIEYAEWFDATNG